MTLSTFHATASSFVSTSTTPGASSKSPILSSLDLMKTIYFDIRQRRSNKTNDRSESDREYYANEPIDENHGVLRPLWQEIQTRASASGRSGRAASAMNRSKAYQSATTLRWFHRNCEGALSSWRGL